MLRRGVSMLRGASTLAVTTKSFARSSQAITRITGEAATSIRCSLAPHAAPASLPPCMPRHRPPSNVSAGRRNRAEGARALAGTAGSRPGFGVVGEEDLAFFKSVLGEKNVVTDADALEGYNTDWMRKFKGASRVALRPRTAEEVAAVLGHCNSRNLAVVPQGGNTGLVGGSVPVWDEVVVSTSRLNQVLSFDEDSGVVVCEAGVILENLETYLSDRGFTVPLDLGAKGSCQIGGNVASNAGGLRLVRWGSLHGSVLGIEAALPDGTLLDTLSTVRKDNTGLDLKQLFIGSEGSLGVITKVAIAAPRKPKAVDVCVVACASFPQVLQAVATARQHLAEILSALELLDEASFTLVLSTFPDLVRNPMEGTHPFYLLIETSGSRAEHDQEKLEGFLEAVMSDGSVVDGVLAADSTQAKSLWKLREKVPLAIAAAPAVFKYDISVPQKDMYSLVEATRSRLASLPAASVFGYGHLGDGNLHLNVTSPSADGEAVLAALEPFVYEWTASKRGSVSAEHGIGQMKRAFLHLSKPPEAIALMRQIKKVFDPKGILNPGKLLPDE